MQACGVERKRVISSIVIIVCSLFIATAVIPECSQSVCGREALAQLYRETEAHRLKSL